MKRTAGLLVALLALFTSGCSSSKDVSAYSESEEKLQILITVTYLETMALPPGSTVRAALYDESHELKPAISSNAITTRGGRDIPVELDVEYPLDQIDDSHEYVIRGEITDPEGKLLFTTDEPIEVETDQEEPQKIDLVLIKAVPAT